VASARNIEAFYAQLDCFNRGDLEAALRYHHPSVEIVTHDPNVAITGKWIGPEEHRRLLCEWHEAWREVRYEVEQLIEVGERVVVVARYRGRGVHSELEVTGRFVWLCDYRDGLLVRWQTFVDLDDALEAAGQPPPQAS
jgi:ketosteroid isomerase-like protein